MSLVAFLVAMLVAEAAAQPSGDRAACANIDVSKPDAVFACLNTFPNRGTLLSPSIECGSLQGVWMIMLEGFGAQRLSHTAARIPSCPVIAEAVRLATGKAPIWAACLVQGRVAGTEQHLRACLQDFVPGAYRVSPASLSDCAQIYERYETGLRYAAPRVVPSAQSQSNRVVVRDGKVVGPEPPPRPRLGPSPFDDPAVQENWGSNADFPKLRTHDCQIAARVAASLSGGAPPEWAACMNYQPSQIASHVRTCLGSAAANIGSCAEGRSLYEAKLKGSHGSALPSNYTPVSCDVLEPILAQAKVAATPPRPAVSQPIEPAPQSSFTFRTPYWLEQLLTTIFVAFLAIAFDQMFCAIRHKKPITDKVAKTFTVDIHDAVVLGSHTWSQTHVSASMSGGYAHGGHVQAPSMSVSSRVVDKHQFFLRFRNDYELPIEIESSGAFPTREGQTVTTFWGKRGADDLTIMALFNTATRHRYFFSGNITDYATKMSEVSGDWIVRAAILAALVVLAFLVLPTIAATFTVAVATLVSLLMRQRSLVRWARTAIASKLVAEVDGSGMILRPA